NFGRCLITVPGGARLSPVRVTQLWIGRWFAGSMRVGQVLLRSVLAGEVRLLFRFDCNVYRRPLGTPWTVLSSAGDAIVLFAFLEEVGHIQKCVAFKAKVYEGRVHAG